MNDAEKYELPHVLPQDTNEKWDEIDGHYFDRAGNAISFRDWARLRQRNRKLDGLTYCRIGVDEIGDYYISTVWIGIDHGFGLGAPLIFETMVFRGEESDLACERYSTEEEAIEGHKRMVEQVRLLAGLDEGESE
jgi:hypothetical protein